MTFLKPEDKEITTGDGSTKTYVLSAFPAIAGREIITQYPMTAIPKIGEYGTNEALMLKLMAFVGVRMPNGDVLPLSTRALVDNHVPDFETLMRIEMAMMEKNCSFFRGGASLRFFEGIAPKVQQLISSMLTASLRQSPGKDSPSSTNSEPSTP